MPSLLIRALVSRCSRATLKPQSSSSLLCRNPLCAPCISPSNHPQSNKFSPIRRNPLRGLSTSLQIDDHGEPESGNLQNVEQKKKKKNPLHLFFKEAVGLCDKIEDSEDETEETETKSGKLKKQLRELEMELRVLKLNPKEIMGLKEKNPERKGSVERKENEQGSSLSTLFSNKQAKEGDGGVFDEEESLKRDDPVIIKELSEDMIVFVRHLYDGGYFNDANFLPMNRFDVGSFENSYGREFVKFAAEKFGKHNQEIAKWLSGSDLKRVAMFGCPSIARKAVLSAKSLRFFFGIQEEAICRRCVLNQSCKFVNRNVWKGVAMKLALVDVMRVIILYALESTPRQLVVSDEVKASVSRLLKEVVNLSKSMK